MTKPFEYQPSVEIDFFNKIKSEIKVVFDIGSRDDVEYLRNSTDDSRSFHLFEPVPEFLNNAIDQIESLEAPDGINVSVSLNDFGLGEKEGELEYYPNTQSFVFRTIHTRSHSQGVVFPIKTLDGYCEENDIDHIDFLKVDIEGMEIDVFNGGKNIINNKTDIVQFEFASTMLDRNLNPDDLVGWFDKDVWSLFLLRVEPAHPYYPHNDQMLTKLNDEIYQRIRQDMIEASGCNLVAIKNELSEKVYNLVNS
jgi:FkbM family methyltransferase